MEIKATEFKVRDLAYGWNELVKYPHLVHDGIHENARVIFYITVLEDDVFYIQLHADRKKVSGDYLLYLW